MYCKHWNLAQRPFENDADPEFFVRSQPHQAALLKLNYLIEHRHGAGVIVGTVGSGKTRVISQLCHERGEQAGPVVCVLFPQMSAVELLSFILAELSDAPADVEMMRLDRVVRQLNQQLKSLQEQGRHPLIVVDDAHLIDDPGVFEVVSQLLNFNESQRRFSLILCGDPAVLATIQRHRQLEERLAVRVVVPALDLNETRQYIRTRLSAAGCERSVFTTAAMEAVFRDSAGLPRRINRLCEMALLVGYADGINEISGQEIEALIPEITTSAA